ncbi:thioredoxin-like protein [Staphylotrichum tortipilum]|uniref:Thioredoxin-like protein n=1 Tax=Staphylotrichum tortipilum TaxID=2831512 RepID=A0AAN6RSW8_9PEZI|nr:thioredoxin-like protein [Staphylotrichum longicolle]
MPPQRRFRALTYLVLAAVVTLLFFTSQARHARTPDTRSLHDFYSRTVTAMDKDHAAAAKPPAQKIIADHDVDADGDIDEDDNIMAELMAARLRQAEQKAKDNAKAKGPNKPELPAEVVGVGSSASGQSRTAPKAKDAEPAPAETEEDHAAEEALNTILKTAPIIIFSKSYCPYSKRAKGILLDKYVIEPPPFVVELDQHPLGPKIQEKLGDMTGRKTVPNVMVYGKSIGGGDDIAALDNERALADKITSLTGARVEVSLRFSQSAQKAG